jgi:hypothetical protein
MKKRLFIAAMASLLLASPVTQAQQQQAPEPAPGAGQPAAGGKGPGMGYDYRRNMGGPGMQTGGQYVQPPAEWQQPVQPPMPDMPPAPSFAQPPQPAPGVMPYGQPMPRYMQPRRQGYGYPGYRGRGWSPYPGHRQYGNPPGVPSGPVQAPTGGCN